MPTALTSGRPGKGSTSLHLILYVPNLQVGGAENMMVKLANFFVRGGHPTTLIVNHKGGFFERRLEKNVNLVTLDAGNNWTAAWRLARYLERHQPPVVLSAIAYPNIAALLARKISKTQTKIVISERNTTSQWLRNRNWSRRALDKKLLRVFYPMADAIIAVSRGVAADLSRTIDVTEGGIEVIYNPTMDDFTWRALAEEPSHDWLRRPGAPVIVGAGTLCKQKDFATLIQAFARLRKQHAARLLIIGDGPERPRLEALVGKLRLEADVSLPGYVENPICFFKRASLFVLSSVFEGFPNVLVEALASGVPVVSTDCPSGPREILEDGQYGGLVPVRDPERLADAMQRALNFPGDPEARIRRAGEFSVDIAGSRYLDVLMSVIPLP